MEKRISKVLVGRIIHLKNEEKIVDLNPGYICINEKGKIISTGIGKPPFMGEEERLDFSGKIILPGLIDLHAHVPQYYQRGRIGKTLLDWLSKYIFPAEIQFKNPRIASNIARRFFKEMLSNGTTTAVLYSSSHRESTNIVFEEAERLGIRAFIGMVLMDRNGPPELLKDIKKAIKDMEFIANKWHKKFDRLFYIVTPRFAVSCSMKLMKEAANFARKNGFYIQTHLSEQKSEIKTVRELFPDYNSYTDVYDKAGLLTSKTIVAHAIHLSDDERKILKERGTSIAHCPSSNFFLRSGVMNLKKAEEYGIKVGFGSDIGAGPFINMFQVSHIAYYANPIHPIKAFYYLTLGAAKILGLDEKIGNFEKGKEADIVVLEPPLSRSNKENIEDLLSSLIFLSDKQNVIATLIKGKLVYKV